MEKIKLLQEKCCIDVNVRDHLGRKPLHVFGCKSHIPRPDTGDFGNFFNAILHPSRHKPQINLAPRSWQPTYWQTEVALQGLLLVGADPLATDHYGNASWFLLAILGGNDLVFLNSLYKVFSVSALCGGILAPILREEAH